MTMSPRDLAAAATGEMSMGEEAMQESMVAHALDPEPDEAPKGPGRVPQVEGITVAQATKQAATLRKAARACPVRQLRYLLHRLAREWEVAAGTCEGEEEDLTIELVGSLSPGMRMPCRNKRGNDDVGTVIRLMTRDGQTSIHVAPDDDNADVYLNFAGSYSPAVVVR